MAGNLYTGETCPVCERPFTERDDIVVCPECGTPHHRACYAEHGGCANEQLHSTGKAWSPHMDSGAVDGMEPLRCSRCGTINAPSALFCQVCGTQLHPEDKQPPAYAGRGAEEEPDPFENVRTMPYNPFVNPFGGLDPEESIDGVPVKDLAIFLGENTHYFLPLFKAMVQTGKKLSWNWGAFIFDFFYYVYRRMNLLAVVVLIVTAALSIPGAIQMAVQTLEAYGMSAAVNVDVELLRGVSGIVTMVSLVLKFMFGGLTNWVYMRFAFSRVRSVRERYADAPEYAEMLAKRGGTSRRNVLIIIVAGMILFSVGSMMLMSSTLIS